MLTDAVLCFILCTGFLFVLTIAGLLFEFAYKKFDIVRRFADGLYAKILK